MTKAAEGEAPKGPAAPMDRATLLAYLASRGYRTATIDHPAVHTVEQSREIELSLPGAHTKNLFLKDEKGHLLLVVAKSSTRVDIKRLGKELGLGRLSFGKPDLMQRVLGVAPGSVTAFAIANDTECQVRIVLDQELMAHDTVNCHPMENVATTNIALADLLSFIRGTGHEPQIMIVSAP